jgi:hypothetical protein
MLGGSQAFSMTLLNTLPANLPPRRLELTVGTRREHHGLYRVRRLSTGHCRAARECIGDLLPIARRVQLRSCWRWRRQPRARDTARGSRTPIATTRSGMRQLVCHVDAMTPTARLRGPSMPSTIPVDALDAGDGCGCLFGVARWNAEGLRVDGPCTGP